MTDTSRSTLYFDKRIGLDAVVGFLLLLAAGIGYVLHQDTRTTTVEVRVDGLEKADKRIEGAISIQKDDLNKRLDRMDEKLDRLIGRR